MAAQRRAMSAHGHRQRHRHGIRGANTGRAVAGAWRAGHRACQARRSARASALRQRHAGPFRRGRPGLLPGRGRRPPGAPGADREPERLVHLRGSGGKKAPARLLDLLANPAFPA